MLTVIAMQSCVGKRSSHWQPREPQNKAATDIFRHKSSMAERRTVFDRYCAASRMLLRSISIVRSASGYCTCEKEFHKCRNTIPTSTLYKLLVRHCSPACNLHVVLQLQLGAAPHNRCTRVWTAGLHSEMPHLHSDCAISCHALC